MKEAWRHVCSCILKPIIQEAHAMELLYDPHGSQSFHVPSYNSINMVSINSSDLYTSSSTTSDLMMCDIPRIGLMYSETFNHDLENYNTSERLKQIRDNQSNGLMLQEGGTTTNVEENDGGASNMEMMNTIMKIGTGSEKGIV